MAELRALMAALLVAACQPAPIAPAAPEIEVDAGTENPPDESVPEPTDCPESIAEMQRRAAHDPRPRALYNIGIAELRCGRLEAATLTFEKVVAQDANLAEAHLQLALAQLELERATLDETIERVNKAIRLAAFKLPRGLMHLALLQMKRNSGDDTTQAKLNIQRAIAVAAHSPEPYALLAQHYWWFAYQRGKNGAADRGFMELSRRVSEDALARHPRFGPLHYTHGLALWSLGETKLSQAAFSRAKQMGPEDPNGGVGVFPSSKPADDAISDFKTNGKPACQSGPGPSCDKYGGELFAAATKYDEAGMPGKAIAVRRMLINPRLGLDHTPEATAAVFELGRSYDRLGIFDHAARFYAQYAKRAPKQPDAQQALERATTYFYLLGNTTAGDTHANDYRSRYGPFDVPTLTPLAPVAGERPKMLRGRAILPPLLISTE